MNIHALSGILGYELQDGNPGKHPLPRWRGFPNPGIKVPSKNAAQPFEVGGFYTEYIRSGFLVRPNNDYDDKYTFDLAISGMVSSRFGTNTRWGNFGAVSCGLEDFSQSALWRMLYGWIT